MADNYLSVWETMCLPFSGDVTQPWSWLYQFAPITINQMKTENPTLEKKIVNEVASYGKQLGKMMEAVQILVKQMDSSRLTSDEKMLLDSFSRMANEITAIKGGHQTPNPDNLETIVATLSYWKERDPAYYEEARQKLLKELQGK
ncbi:MAG: hypothetical protein ACM3PE_09075 [Deltaproteobacteria bacterium]